MTKVDELLQFGMVLCVVGLTLLVGCGPLETRSELTYDPELFPVSYRIFDQTGLPVSNTDVEVRFPPDGDTCRPVEAIGSVELTRTTDSSGVAVFRRVVGCDIQLVRLGFPDLPSSASDLGRSLSELEQYRITDGPFSTEVGVRVFIPTVIAASEGDQPRDIELLFSPVDWPYSWAKTSAELQGISSCFGRVDDARELFEPPAHPVTMSNCRSVDSLELWLRMDVGGERLLTNTILEITCSADFDYRCQVRAP